MDSEQIATKKAIQFEIGHGIKALWQGKRGRKWNEAGVEYKEELTKPSSLY